LAQSFFNFFVFTSTSSCKLEKCSICREKEIIIEMLHIEYNEWMNGIKLHVDVGMYAKQHIIIQLSHNKQTARTPNCEVQYSHSKEDMRYLLAVDWLLPSPLTLSQVLSLAVAFPLTPALLSLTTLLVYLHD
jgi:hypothetical protein